MISCLLDRRGALIFWPLRRFLYDLQELGIECFLFFSYMTNLYWSEAKTHPSKRPEDNGNSIRRWSKPMLLCFIPFFFFQHKWQELVNVKPQSQSYGVHLKASSGTPLLPLDYRNTKASRGAEPKKGNYDNKNASISSRGNNDLAACAEGTKVRLLNRQLHQD